jgi:hypothetical protein
MARLLRSRCRRTVHTGRGWYLRTGRFQGPVSDLENQSRFLGQGDELIRRDNPSAWTIPANQGLGADQLVTIDLRRIVNLELTQPDRLAEVFLQRSAGVDGSLQGWRKEISKTRLCGGLS